MFGQNTRLSGRRSRKRYVSAAAEKFYGLHILATSRRGHGRKTAMEYDVFISHASEDKEDLVDPLATELRKCGLNVWYDRFVLKLGDSLCGKIDEGLAASKYGVVVLSPSFFGKKWPKAELDALFTRQGAGEEKVLLPVWHKMRAEDVASQSPLLASIFATHTDKGLLGVVGDILEVARPDLGRFAVDESGRYICQIQGGPFEGLHVLLVDAPPAPFGGPKDVLKGDVFASVEVDGKCYATRLVRRPKLPHLLTAEDTWTLPLPGSGVGMRRQGSIVEVVQLCARYRYTGVQSRADGMLIPVFTFDREEHVITRI